MGAAVAPAARRQRDQVVVVVVVVRFGVGNRRRHGHGAPSWTPHVRTAGHRDSGSPRLRGRSVTREKHITRHVVHV